MDYFLSCDWGTSSFRLKLVQTTGLKTTNRLEHHDLGFGQISLSVDEKLSLLQEKMDKVCQHQSVAADIPCILSGMASSSIGIRELPYGRLPLSLDNFMLPYEKLKEHIYLFSGLSDQEDVMRGEEVQILGAARMYGNIRQGLAILPGTHSKHAVIQGNKLTHFKTYLTGELFALLSQHSILRHSVAAAERASTSFSAFRDGLNKSDGNLLNELFSIRARQLLRGHMPDYNHDFLSGVLIGSELKALEKLSPGEILLIADGKLAELYDAAIRYFFPEVNLHLCSTEEATILGHWQLLKQIHA